MSRRKIVIIWLISGVILTLLLTAILGVFLSISILEHVALFLGWLLLMAFLWLLFKGLRRLVRK